MTARRRGAPLRSCCLLLALLVCAPAHAETASQLLSTAWNELLRGNPERAVKTADSVLATDPDEHAALAVKALAYERMDDHRRADAWLATYLDRTEGRTQEPEALALARRLDVILADQPRAGPIQDVRPTRAKPTRVEPTIKSKQLKTRAVSRSATPKGYGPAFGDGFVALGALSGGRSYAQVPCASGDGCEPRDATAQGFRALDGGAPGGGLSLRAEYFVLGGYVGPRLRYDLLAPEPVGDYAPGSGSRPSHRFDVGAIARVPVVKDAVRVHVLADLGYGVRTLRAYVGDRDVPGLAHSLVAHQLVGGIGARIEPRPKVGIGARVGVGGLLGAGGGISDIQIEAHAVLRPIDRLQVHAGFDLRRTALLAGLGGEAAQLTDVSAGLWLGVGIAL